MKTYEIPFIQNEYISIDEIYDRNKIDITDKIVKIIFDYISYIIYDSDIFTNIHNQDFIDYIIDEIYFELQSEYKDELEEELNEYNIDIIKDILYQLYKLDKKYLEINAKLIYDKYNVENGFDYFVLIRIEPNSFDYRLEVLNEKLDDFNGSKFVMHEIKLKDKLNFDYYGTRLDIYLYLDGVYMSDGFGGVMEYGDFSLREN